MSMSPELIALLCCPRCRSTLTYDAAKSQLDSPCGAAYRVKEGVAKLSAKPYVASFSRQWNRYDVMRPEEDEAVFRSKTGVGPRDLKGQLVLDAGCGGGRYSALLGRAGARVIGVDLSDAVEKARAITAESPDVLIAQADLNDLPLAEGAFDFVFSIGVLHHGPDPRGAFAQIARRVRPGGRLAVWLYRRNTPPQEWTNKALRLVTTRLPERVVEGLCAGLGVLGGVPVVNRTLNKVVNFSAHPDWTLRVCDNFDWYSPRYQSHHTLDELRRWFEEEGFHDLVDLRPLKTGNAYDWAYDRGLLIGSGVNVVGTRR
jgi:SAM-dependent methyltransferase